MTHYDIYASDLKEHLLDDKITVLKVYDDDGNSIEYKRVTDGKWVHLQGTDYQCSGCNVWWSWDGTAEENGMFYCPNCGNRNVVNDGNKSEV